MSSRWKAGAALLLGSVCGLVEVSGPALAAEAEPRPRVAVLAADNPTANPWWQEAGSQRAQELLISRLATSRQYRVVARHHLARTLEEKEIWFTDALSPAKAVRLGRELGVDFLLAGSLLEFGTGAEGKKARKSRKLLGLGGLKAFKVDFSLRLIDVATGASVWVDSRQAVVELGKAAGPVDATDFRREREIYETSLVPLLEDLAAQLVSAAPGRTQTTEVAE